MLKRNYSLFEGELCKEDFGIRKKQKIEQSTLHFLLEQIERLPISVQRLIRDNYNPYIVNKTVSGKLIKNGQFIFLIHRNIIVWNCSGLVEIPSIVPEISIPFPEEMDSINPDLLVFAGRDGVDLFIVSSPNLLYYWCEKDNKYISLELPLHSSSVISIIPNPSKREVFVLTSSLSIFSIEVKESQVEYYDEKVTWTMQMRTEYSLSPTLIYRHASILHTVLSTFLPLSTTTISVCNIAVDYPYAYCVESSCLRGFDLENRSLVFSQPLTLPTSSIIMGCQVGRSLLVILTKLEDQYFLHIYQLQQTSADFSSTISLPRNEYKNCSIQIQETYQDIEINLVVLSKTSTVYNIAFSTKQWYMYQLYLQDVLFTGIHVMNPGVIFVTSSHVISFVPEGNSKKEAITAGSCCAVEDICPPVSILSRIVSYYHQKFYKQACFLFSVALKQKLICAETLASLYHLISSQPESRDRTNLLIAFVDCFSLFKVIHLIASKKEEIEQDINQSIQHAIMELLCKNEDMITLLPQITNFTNSLLNHFKEFNHQLPSSISINILTWTELPCIHAAYSKLFDAITSCPHIHYHKDIVEDCMISIIQLFTSTLSTTKHPIVDLCIEQLEHTHYASTIPLLQQQKYYSYLVRQGETLLPFSKDNRQFAEYCLHHFLLHPSPLIFPLLDQWPSLVHIIQNQPFILIQYRIHSKMPITSPNEIVDLIQKIPDNQQRQEVLALLYFEMMTGEFDAHSKEVINSLIVMNQMESWLIQEAKLNNSIPLDSLWIHCLDRVDRLYDTTTEILDKMISILFCRKQLMLNSDRIVVALLHHALCIDEFLMAQSELDLQKSALYYILSRLQPEEVIEWEESLLSEYHISDDYYQFWTVICKNVQ